MYMVERSKVIVFEPKKCVYYFISAWLKNWVFALYSNYDYTFILWNLWIQNKASGIYYLLHIHTDRFAIGILINLKIQQVVTSDFFSAKCL